jgi:hypothetical protein
MAQEMNVETGDVSKEKKMGTVKRLWKVGMEDR